MSEADRKRIGDVCPGVAAELVRLAEELAMSTDDRSDEDVWARAQRALDERASHHTESDALKARLTAYIAERSALEAKGEVPRGVRRRGERLLEEISALEERRDRLARAQERSQLAPEGGAQPDRAPNERASKPPRRPSQAQNPDRPQRRVDRDPGRRSWE